MKKHIFSIVLSLISLMMYAQTYDVTITGIVTDEITGNPVIGQDIYIYADTAGFTYFNTIITSDGGYYEDIIPVPMGSQGVIEVSTMSCGAIITQTDFFSQNSSQLFLDFQICTNPSGNDCQAMYYYYPGFDPLSIQFIDDSWGNIDSWHWDFGDGTTSNEQDPLHFFSQQGDYLTSLTISGDSCQSMFEMLIRVNYDTIGDCEAYYYYSPGTEALSIEFYDASFGNVISWDWEFGDGNISSAQNPIHTYDIGGDYLVSLTIETIDSCTSNFESFIFIEDDTTYCIAAFNAELDTLNNTPHTYIFTDQSEGEYEFLYWDFGDGTFSFDQNPVHIYNDGGSYDVCLTISTPPGNIMCTSTHCEQISTLEYFNFGGQAFIGNYPINIDSTDDANIAPIDEEL